MGSSPSGKRAWWTRLRQRAGWLRQEITALSLAMGDPRTPWTAKAVAGLAVGYALSPIDLIPDFIPVLGYLDDLLLLPVLIALAIRLIPGEVMEQSRERAKEQRAAKGTRKWRYAIPVLAVWLVLLMVIVVLVYRAVR